MAPRPMNPYQPIDSAVLEAMLQYSQGGPSPFYSQQDINAYPWIMPPADEDDIGTLDYQNASFTAQKKAQDLMMDPSFLLAQGANLGGYGPEAFGMQQRYQPINAEGYMRAQQLAQSEDPVTRFIAGRALAGGNPLSIAADIRNAIENPQDDDEAALGQLFAQVIPPATWNGQPIQGQLDYSALDSTIAQITGPMSEDNPMWDGQTFDPQTGLPAIVYEEPTAAQQALERAGFTHNPYETYDPNLFAAPEALEQEQAWMDAYEPVSQRMVATKDMEAQLRALLENQMRDPAEFLAPPAGRSQPAATGGQAPQTPQGGMTPQRGGWADDLERLTQDPVAQLRGMLPSESPASWLDRNIGNKIEGFFNPDSQTQSGGAPQAPPRSYISSDPNLTGEVSPRGPVRAGTTLSDASRRSAGGDSRESMLRRQLGLNTGDQVRARDALIQSAYQRALAQRGQGQRQQHVNDLAAQGHTPFNARLQAQMRTLWG